MSIVAFAEELPVDRSEPHGSFPMNAVRDARQHDIDPTAALHDSRESLLTVDRQIRDKQSTDSRNQSQDETAGESVLQALPQNDPQIHNPMPEDRVGHAEKCRGVEREDERHHQTELKTLSASPKAIEQNNRCGRGCAQRCAEYQNPNPATFVQTISPVITDEQDPDTH